jgi:hypothetical protein
MSIYDKSLRGVAEVAAKIMEQTTPKTEKEKDLAALGHPKDKITHKDVLIGRGVLKKEDVDLDEGMGKTLAHAVGKVVKAVAPNWVEKQQRAEDEKIKAAKRVAMDKFTSIAQKDVKKEEKEDLDEASYSAKKARAGEDIGKPGKMFSKIAKSAAERYGSEEKGKKVAGAVLAKLRKEEKSCEDEAEEALDKHEKKMHGKKGEVANHEKEMHKEESEQLQEYESKGGVYRHKGTYGREKGSDYGGTDWDKEESNKKEKPKAKKYGARQNYVRSNRVNESFTEMLSVYREGGIKSLMEATQLDEEPDNETFTKEVEDQKSSMTGKKKQPSVAAAATQGVKTMPEEVEELDERELSASETAKKEKYVKSMKKNLAGFKERYGARGKEVMYATATKMAKED